MNPETGEIIFREQQNETLIKQEYMIFREMKNIFLWNRNI